MTKVVKKKVKRRKLSFKKLFVFLIFILFSCFVIGQVYKIPIKNIFIENNYYLTDQEIIEAAGISDYPSALKNTSSTIKKKLLKNSLIRDVVIKKNFFTKVYIKVYENRPLFYNKSNNKYVLMNGTEIDKAYTVPTLINYTPEDKYKVFVDRMSTISIDVLNRISEIEYTPNNVDKNRFLFYMTDGNAVYITLNNFDIVNNYIDIIRKFDNKKGVLYLDSGVYFKIID